MFTSEPTLIQRIERMIRDTKIVDAHARIRCDQPSAPDLATLMSHPALLAELRGVGFADDGSPSLDQVRRAIPYLKKTRNTAAAWTFYRILRDLFDFHDPNLTEQNFEAVDQRIQTAARDANWVNYVLKERCNLETLVTSATKVGGNEGKHGKLFARCLSLDSLFHAGASSDLLPEFAGHRGKTGYFDGLTALLGSGLENPDILERRLFDWLDATLTSDVKFARTFLPIDQRFASPDDISTAKVLTRASSGGDIDPFDADILIEFVAYKIVEWHHQHKRTLQLAVGAETMAHGELNVPRYQGSWATDMARIFRNFAGAKFDIMLASDSLGNEVAALAAQLPNVTLTGGWSHTNSPPVIERNVAIRLQSTPMTKFAGFTSEAPFAEWTYGHLQVVGKVTAAAFAHLIDTGYYEEYEVPAMLEQILYHTPREVFGLV